MPAPYTAAPCPSRSTSLELIAQVKDQVKENIRKDEYDVSSFYHRKGFCQWLARHPRFENLTLLVIGLNALWIWVDTDLNPGPMLIMSPPVFQFAEHFFCCYFSYEWTIRFLAFKRKRDCLRDFWFVFDSFLVWTMIIETWMMSAVFLVAMGSIGGGMGNASILRIARLLRLTRMARMARLLRALPELLILIEGMVKALKSVCFALGLLAVILYVFGIAFTQLCEDTSLEDHFGTVLRSMHTLLVYGALMDEVSMLIIEIEAESIFILLVFYMFILVAALTVMNMLIGVICEMVLKVGASERQQATQSFVTEKLTDLINTGADENNDNLISKDEFIKMLNNKEATAILNDVNIDVIGLVDFIDIIFEPVNGEEEKLLTLPEFMKVILDLRGDQMAKVRDLMAMKQYIQSCFMRLEEKLFDDGRLPNNKAEKPMLPTAPVTETRNSILQEASEACASFSNWGSKTTPQESEPMSMKALQEQMNISLRKVEIAHERELARLHAENMKLLDRLTDLGAAAGKPPGAVPASPAGAPMVPMESRVEQPQVQKDGVPNGEDGVRKIPQEAKRDRVGLGSAAADRWKGRGARDPAKQGNGHMDKWGEEARYSRGRRSRSAE
mmetsp:Transcript_67632/g.130627  ORF Transcript_67632/g.130627 Transcript_67632/m.130627 type:complete len:614 (-) Transcript_67632:195-2036(-)